jgi:predicted MFS family arabinose efflux permease
LTRLIFYKVHFSESEIPYTLLLVGVLAAIIGSVLGKILFAKTTMKSIQKMVCIALIILGSSILTGLI